MKYVILACDILCVLSWTIAALTATSQSTMFMNAACALIWAVTAVITTLTYFKKK